MCAAAGVDDIVALSLMAVGVVCGDADVKQGGHSLRCCVQPLVLKLEGGKTV